MGRKLWSPCESKIKNSHMYRFMSFVNERYDLNFSSYEPLHSWSVENIPHFWSSFWDYSQITHSQPFTTVVDDLKKMPGAKWFEGTRLNFAENLLRFRDEETALIFKGEARPVTKMSYKRLYEETAKVASSLRKLNIEPGERVVGLMPNMPETVIAMLAATSMGAVWSSCSPDFGRKGVIDRFGQIKPKVLFTADGYFYKGKKIDSLGLVADIMKEIPSIEKVIVVPYMENEPHIEGIPHSILFRDFKSTEEGLEIDFKQLPFDHPLYIMYSSGTTGLPKCMVQSAGGILINQLKEHILHTDVGRADNIFYFTTCGWMMWNWLVCALGTGAALVLFDGNPFHPHAGALWALAEEVGMTVFGTSAGYLAALENAGVRPGKEYNLSNLRAILSTGSPLPEEGFDFVYREIKENIQLASISGGSDLNGCFALGNPMGPVYSGELQCRGLGMKVEAFDEEGKSVINRQGELVCTAPFPSMPIYFWDDPDGEKYRHAYFDVYPGVWRHGDYIEINERGGVVIHGRSDATLNPGGVRIGTADIYSIVELFEEVEDSIVVGQKWNKDVRVILFVKLNAGYELTEELKKRIKASLRSEASPRHVPAKIIAVADIPYTLNMKKVEIAVRKVIHGEAVLNKDALRNPEALECYKGIEALGEE